MSTLDNLRKAAKRWLKALRDGDAQTRAARLRRAHPGAPRTSQPFATFSMRSRANAVTTAGSRSQCRWPIAYRAETPLTRSARAASRGRRARPLHAILDEHPDSHQRARNADRPTRDLRTALHFGVGARSGREDAARTRRRPEHP